MFPTLKLQSCICCSRENAQTITKGKRISLVTLFLLCMGWFTSWRFVAEIFAVDKMPQCWVRCLKGLNAIVRLERSQHHLAQLHG